MEVIIENTLQLYFWTHLQFLLFHFVLYIVFWPTGFQKFVQPFMKD